MYIWELAEPVEPEFTGLNHAVRAALATFMDAVVLVDPIHYQRRPDERADPPALLRTLHFGAHAEGLVTFLVYPPDELVLVVKIQWIGD
jgi:hypothetical protein